MEKLKEMDSMWNTWIASWQRLGCVFGLCPLDLTDHSDLTKALTMLFKNIAIISELLIWAYDVEYKLMFFSLEFAAVLAVVERLIKDLCSHLSPCTVLRY